MVDWPTVLQALREGKVDPTIMLTHRISIEDIAKGYYWHEQKKDGVVKFYVETKFSAPRLEGTPEVKKLD